MAWQIIAEGNIDTFEQASPTILSLEKDTPILLRINLSKWAPFSSQIFNLWGAEWWGQKVAPAGMIVDDVYGGKNADLTEWVEIKGHADPLAVPLLITIIVASVVGLGIIAWMVVSIKLSADVRVREQTKLEFIEARLKEGYTPAQIDSWLKGIESPPPEVTLPGLPSIAGISAGWWVLIIAGIVLFLIFRKK